MALSERLPARDRKPVAAKSGAVSPGVTPAQTRLLLTATSFTFSEVGLGEIDVVRAGDGPVYLVCNHHGFYTDDRGTLTYDRRKLRALTLDQALQRVQGLIAEVRRPVEPRELKAWIAGIKGRSNDSKAYRDMGRLLLAGDMQAAANFYHDQDTAVRDSIPVRFVLMMRVKD